MEAQLFATELIVYLPIMDAEHLQIERLLEELNVAITRSASPQRKADLLQRLVKEVGGHFSHEERLMRDSRYPELLWHKRQHTAARRKLKELLAAFAEEDFVTALSRVEAIAAWLTSHISVADRMLGSHLRNHDREFGGRANAGTLRRARVH